MADLLSNFEPMSNYSISRRIQFVIQYIHDQHYASKDQILSFLEQKEFYISSRTLERDFEKIKADFGIELSYCKLHRGYFIDKDKSVKVESFFKFLELVTLADVFSDGLQNNHKILEYVIFDDSSQLKGVENLHPILLAIKQERDLEFTHYNFHKDTYKTKLITPIILKEYLNRWYVIGVPKGEEEIRTYGIERITHIKLGELSTLKKQKYYQQTHQFENIIGLMFTDQQPEKIQLKVTHLHTKYLESLPLHSSQEIQTSEQPGYSLVSYRLIPNYEFSIQILKMSIHAEVISPQWYRKYIKEEIDKIQLKYQND